MLISTGWFSSILISSRAFKVLPDRARKKILPSSAVCLHFEAAEDEHKLQSEPCLSDMTPLLCYILTQVQNARVITQELNSRFGLRGVGCNMTNWMWGAQTCRRLWRAPPSWEFCLTTGNQTLFPSWSQVTIRWAVNLEQWLARPIASLTHTKTSLIIQSR